MSFARTLLLVAAPLVVLVHGCADGVEGDTGDPGLYLPPAGDDASAAIDAQGSTARPDAAGDDASTLLDAASLPGDGAAPVDAAQGADSSLGACATALAALKYDFEGGAQGWTHSILDGASANWPLDEWQQGKATTGPGACHGGTGCFATRLDANYTSCERAELESPAVDLTACASSTVKLVFWHAYDFWTANLGGTNYYDGGIVEVSSDGGSTWGAPAGASFPGTVKINRTMTNTQCILNNAFHVDGKAGFTSPAVTSWTKVEIALPAAMLTAHFKVRFAYGSGVSHDSTDAEVDRPFARPGWYIDDVGFVTP